MAVFWKSLYCSFIGLNLSPRTQGPSSCDWLAYLSFPNMLYVTLPVMCLFKFSLCPIDLSLNCFHLVTFYPPSIYRSNSTPASLKLFLIFQQTEQSPSKCCRTSFSKPSHETVLFLLAFDFLCLSLISPVKFRCS